MVHAERTALIEDLATLRPEQWDMPSWCSGWTVHDVAAHLVDNARTTRAGFVLALVRARFDFDRLNQRGLDTARGETPDVTLRRLQEVARRTSGPPASADTRLVEEVMHGEDIRRPLGIVHDYAPEAVRRALSLQARTSEAFGGAKELVGQVRLVATDTDLEVGQGNAVYGPALSLLLVASGRKNARADLTGATSLLP